MNVSISGTSGAIVNTAAVTMTGIENISVSNFQTADDAGGVATINEWQNTIDLSQASGVTGIAVTASSANGDTAFTNVAAIVTAAMGNGAGDLTITYANAAVAGTADAQTLTLTGQTAGTFAVRGTAATGGIETLNIVSNTAANTIAISDSGTPTITTINVTGDQNLTLTEATDKPDTAVTTLNAGTFTGNLTATTGGAAGDMSITGGTGNDTITLGNFTADDSVDGGAGTDSLSVAVAIIETDLANVTGIETLKVTGGANVTLAANVVPTTFTVSDATASVVTLNTGYTAATAVNLGQDDTVTNTANVALTINATAANMIANNDITITGGSGTDTLNLTADSSAATLLASRVTLVDTITIVDGGDTTTTAGKDVSITTGAYATSLTIDASALDQGTTAALGETLTVDGTLAIATKVLNITGGAGNDTITGGAGNDIISGGAGDDSINGGAATASNDSISGGDGNDTINMADKLTTADTIDGGAGTDTLLVTSLSAAALAGVTNVENLGFTGSATLTSNLSFTSIDMTTAAAGDVLTLSTGYTNATTVTLNNGDKVVNSANVAMTVNADAANLETADATTITGGTGADTLNITADTTSPAVITLANLITKVDTITIVDGGDAVSGTVTAGKDISITTGAYATSLTIDGSAMDQGTTAALGETLTVDGSGVSTATVVLNITGGAGNDSLTGGAGNDIISGGAGNDSINGGSGGNDTIATVSGTNTINMAGALTYQDSITGGTGTDTLIVNAGASDVDFQNTTGIETLTLNDVAATTTLATFAQAAGIATVNLVTATARTVTATGMSSGVNFVAGGDVNENVTGGSGDDTFTFNYATNGTTGGSIDANDVLNGGAGTDTIVIKNSANATLTYVAAINFNNVTNVENVTIGTASGKASTSAEIITLDVSTAITSTTAATISLNGSVITDSNDTINITNGNTSTTTKFSITGGAGDDTLAGGAAADTISGGDGDDTITGGLGADSLTGGAGNDTFAYAVDSAFAAVPSGNLASDTISDLVSGADTIAITLNATGKTVNAAYVGTATSNAEALSLLSSKAGEYFFNTTTKQLVMDIDGNGLLQANDLYVNLTGATALATGDVVMTVTGATVMTLGAGDDTVDVTAGNDYNIDGGDGNDTFNATQATLDSDNDGSDDTLIGGAGTDTLNIAGTGATALTQDAKIATIENITFTSATHALDISGQTEAFNITFNSGTNSVTTTTTAAHSITGGAGADTVTVADQAALAGLASFAGGGTTSDGDVIALTAASLLIVDADFSGFTSVDTLQLGGAANTVVLGTNATAANLLTVVTGTGNTSITSTEAANTVNAASINGTLTLAGSANYTVSAGVTATAVTATTATGTLAVTYADLTGQASTLTTGAGATTVTTTTGSASDTITIAAAALAQNVNLTLNGSAGAGSIVNVTGLVGNLVATNHTSGGAITVTTGDAADNGISLTTGATAFNANVTTGAATDTVAINATTLANGVALTINAVGAGAAGTVNVTGLTGDLVLTNATTGTIGVAVANNATDDGIAITAGAAALNVTAVADGDTVTVTALTGNFTGAIAGTTGKFNVTAGVGAQTITTGAGADTIVGGAGADNITGGTGVDNYKYTATTEGGDTISGFVVGTDIIQFTAALANGSSTGATALATQYLSAATAITANATIYNYTAALADTAAATVAAASLANGALGFATGTEGVGDKLLIVVHSASTTAVYAYVYVAADDVIAAGELTLLATLTGVTTGLTTASGADFLTA